MINNPEKFQKSNDQQEEESFFQFDIPYGGLIVFDDADPDVVIADILDKYAEDPIIPMLRITDPNDPYIQELQATRPPKFQDKNIKCVILPIRYKKVFRA